MGMILLDVVSRIERTFQVLIPRNWLNELGIRQAGDDATLQSLHECLLRLCQSQNVAPPGDSWERLVRLIADASGADIVELGVETQLVRDVAPFG